MKNECRDLAKQLIKHFTFRYFHTVDANLKVMIEYRVTSRKKSFDHVENKVETSRLNYTILRKKVKKKQKTILRINVKITVLVLSQPTASYQLYRMLGVDELVKQLDQLPYCVL